MPSLVHRPTHLSQEIHLTGPGTDTLDTPLRDPVSNDGRRHKRAMWEPTSAPHGPDDAGVLALRGKLFAARDIGLAAVPSAMEALNDGRVMPTRQVRGLDPPGLARSPRSGAVFFESPIIEASLFDVLRDTVGDQVRKCGVWCVAPARPRGRLALGPVGCRTSRWGCWTCGGIGPMGVCSGG